MSRIKLHTVATESGILSLDEVTHALGKAPVSRGVAMFRGVSTDSRTIAAGDLFVALKGERFDGNDFAADAFAKGAAGAVLSRLKRSAEFRDRTIFVVDDTLHALGEIARVYRSKLSTRIVGVTGSNGKTTTKEMVYHILSKFRRVTKAQKSFNNFIGVPLTVLSIHRDDEFAVVEMGTSAHGEIARLAEIAQPNIGIITNVSQTHLEGLGSVEGVAEAKGELLDKLPCDGAAVLNWDNPWTRALSCRCDCPVLFFGEASEADLRVTRISSDESGISFLLNGFRVRIPVHGRHNALNAAAAAAACLSAGLEIKDIIGSLANFKLPDMRLSVRRLNGITLINDAYNANPASVSAAIETLRDWRGARRRVFVFGDMLELGDASEELHREIGRKVAQSGIDHLWTMGERAKQTAESAIADGMSAEFVHHCASLEEISESLGRFIADGDVVLFKASRGMTFEKIISAVERILGK